MPRRLYCALFFGLALGACGGDPPPAGPAAVAGLYRLRSINGQPVPYGIPTSSGFFWITHGELLLRPDGTFTAGIADGDGGVAVGTYSVSGGSVLALRPQTGGYGEAIVLSGFVAGDSAVVEVPGAPWAPSSSGSRYAYQRSVVPTPGPVTAGTYVLSEVNGVPEGVGGAGFVFYDGTSAGHRFVRRVLFDTLTFADGVFFRRHRATLDSSFWVDAPAPTTASRNGVDWGSYTGGAAAIALQPYAEPGSAPDSLRVASQTLTRRSDLGVAVVEERYTRVP